MKPQLGPLLTKRLRLRRYTPEDADLILRLISNPDVMRYFGRVYDRDQAQKMLDLFIKSYADFGYSVLAVERLSDNAFLGQIGLLHWDDVDAREDVEAAYMLLPEAWGNGYATEAARAVRDWAFTNLACDRVTSFIVVENAPSFAVAERNGMSRTKRLEENRFKQPIYVYAITREEWSALHPTIRDAAPADAAALAPLFEQLGYPTSAEQIRNRLKLSDADARVLVAADGEQIRGFVAVAMSDDFIVGRRGTILGMVVAEGARSAGIGATLLEAAQAWAFERGARRVAVRSNVIRDRAHRFYERQGYTRIKSQNVFEKAKPDLKGEG